MQHKHLVDAGSHTFTTKASCSKTPATQGQVLWLAGARCESGAARLWAMWKCGTQMTGNVLRQLYKGFRLFLQLHQSASDNIQSASPADEVRGPSRK